ncbi:MAG: hypothetical protein DME55_15390 [Verrucomicrobia bacterium]|nr:MAG: hypothetical protein DME55_15390 [Verrucomicrobiota bacterium]
MISSWAELPLAASEQESWRRSFTNDAFRSYRSIWQESVQEMRRLLGIAIEGVKDGALSTGYETLRMMGAFDRKISGSGTISAAASMFLASRYAVSPLQGLRVAATATGADTDTLASMTASILGALNGDEWIAPFREQSQDADYLVAIANAFDSNLQQKSTLGHSAQRISKRTTAAFLEALEKLTTPTPITLLDGRRAMLIAKEELPCTGKTYRAWRWRLETQDGQTIFIKKTRRRSAKDIPPLLETRIEVVRLGLKIFVDDLAKAKEFYTSLLGLPLDKETASAFTVNGILSVQRSNNRAFRTFERPQDGTCGPLLCLRVTNLQEAYRMLSARGVKIVEELRQQKSYCSFRVADPSGNLVEIFESTSSATPAPC